MQRCLTFLTDHSMTGLVLNLEELQTLALSAADQTRLGVSKTERDEMDGLLKKLDDAKRDQLADIRSISEAIRQADLLFSEKVRADLSWCDLPKVILVGVIRVLHDLCTTWDKFVPILTATDVFTSLYLPRLSARKIEMQNLQSMPSKCAAQIVKSHINVLMPLDRMAELLDDFAEPARFVEFLIKMIHRHQRMDAADFDETLFKQCREEAYQMFKYSIGQAMVDRPHAVVQMLLMMTFPRLFGCSHTAVGIYVPLDVALGEDMKEVAELHSGNACMRARSTAGGLIVPPFAGCFLRCARELLTKDGASAKSFLAMLGEPMLANVMSDRGYAVQHAVALELCNYASQLQVFIWKALKDGDECGFSLEPSRSFCAPLERFKTYTLLRKQCEATLSRSVVYEVCDDLRVRNRLIDIFRHFTFAQTRYKQFFEVKSGIDVKKLWEALGVFFRQSDSVGDDVVLLFLSVNPFLYYDPSSQSISTITDTVPEVDDDDDDDDDDVDEKVPTQRCPIVLRTGKRIGQACGKSAVGMRGDGRLCGAHVRQKTAMEHSNAIAAYKWYQEHKCDRTAAGLLKYCVLEGADWLEQCSLPISTLVKLETATVDEIMQARRQLQSLI
eukprot:TRINITY_DN1145_c0_g1_i1.p1 TRINITY_DN1145_c0_g1~~TRINITY_DN1145_c0_g1_i1.p1  ORF type:complete len:614 (+),score=104.51 TRINITY_DN1145_c0_g1_i1:1471-3312(+)